MDFRLSRKGFTRVEIMIGVAIIGLLAAIGIPNMLKAGVNTRKEQSAPYILPTILMSLHSGLTAAHPKHEGCSFTA